MKTAPEKNPIRKNFKPSAGWGAAAALGLVLALGGCRVIGGKPDQNMAATRAAETLAARSGNGAEAAPTSQPTPTPPPANTASPVPTATAGPTATPTPELGLTVRFEQLTGFDSLFLEFAVVNRGAVSLESASVAVTDPDTGTTLPARERDGFGKVGGEGGGGSEIEALDPGQSGWAYSGFFQPDQLPASGHELQAEIRACTGDGLTGRCITEGLTITMP